jgi:hypothetical protein
MKLPHRLNSRLKANIGCLLIESMLERAFAKHPGRRTQRWIRENILRPTSQENLHRKDACTC